ncbi:hypothetical protein BLNAU_23596 [Blattamonas nauphoetae]|uniref:Uncharacterized protein n=1 Tax=Blattamonas nauphoetae TaxID=2049346 RepID=A0ABQ9WQV2_9EUKA|nr:hypothetical protein BLNAU_23596 [Blattamonas nauphoetae]
MSLFTRTVKEVLSAGTDDLFGLNNKSGEVRAEIVCLFAEHEGQIGANRTEMVCRFYTQLNFRAKDVILRERNQEEEAPPLVKL